MSNRYGVQIEDRPLPSAPGDRDRDVFLYRVVDHGVVNAWGQSLQIANFLPQVEAEDRARRLNEQDEQNQLAVMWSQKPNE